MSQEKSEIKNQKSDQSQEQLQPLIDINKNQKVGLSLYKNKSEKLLKLKSLRNINLEGDIENARKILKLQKKIGAKNQKFVQLESQLQTIEEKIKEKKKQLLKGHIQQIVSYKNQRKLHNLKADNQIVQAKRNRRKKEEKHKRIQEEIEKQYNREYRFALGERKKRNELYSISEIKKHEKKYEDQKQRQEKKTLESKKRSRRVKSQMNSTEPSDYFNEFSNLKLDHRSLMDQRIKTQIQEIKQRDQRKKENVLKMIERRLEYGNKKGKEVLSSQSKLKPKSLFEHNKQFLLLVRERQMQQQDRVQAILAQKKPRLQTNIKKDLTAIQSTQTEIKNILKRSNIDPIDKLLQIKRMEKRLEEKVNSGREESVEVLAQLGLAKAKLFLNPETFKGQ